VPFPQLGEHSPVVSDARMSPQGVQLVPLRTFPSCRQKNVKLSVAKNRSCSATNYRCDCYSRAHLVCADPIRNPSAHHRSRFAFSTTISAETQGVSGVRAQSLPHHRRTRVTDDLFSGSNAASHLMVVSARMIGSNPGCPGAPFIFIAKRNTCRTALPHCLGVAM
jgi:hypothetical protein